MRPPTNRTRGRAVPPPLPAPEQRPAPAADEHYDNLGLVELRFSPSLSWRAFRRFAAKHGLAHTPQRDEPQIFLSPSGIEVAYGMYNVTPLPREVQELWLVGADGPSVEATIALVAAMLEAWPHASWTPDDYNDFTPLLRRHFPDREGAKTK